MAAEQETGQQPAIRADQWANTALMAILTFGWLAYVAWTIMEKRKDSRQMEKFQQDIRERADLGRWEMEHAPGTPGTPGDDGE